MSEGPTIPISEEIHAQKHRLPHESFRDATARVANALKDSDEHFVDFKGILRHMRFLPGGRIQAAMGAPRMVTPYNCFVSRPIDDSMDGIMQAAHEAAQTMRLGGGIGYDFSSIRPRGDRIKTLGSRASGPVSFMSIFDATCKTIASAGHRRGAQMGVLRVDHPDIWEFIKAKQNSTNLTAFNISVGVTDEFMQAVVNDDTFELVWGGQVYEEVEARALWDEIMRSTWDWAEPGVLFIDRINEQNNLWYCETIAATNPCGEQPLPPFGACLLGSFNLTQYVYLTDAGYWDFDWKMFYLDIPVVVRAMDNVVDRATYPLPEQRREAQDKRRMGLGVTGLANAAEVLGFPYGSTEFLAFQEVVLKALKDETYRSSALLAAEKGPFPLYDRNRYLASPYIQSLAPDVLDLIRQHGIRNSHLTSIAPTGTISLGADNVSSGIEPVFSYGYDRTIQTFEGPKVERVEDYGYRVWGTEGVTADECTIDQHVDVLLAASKYIDSAVSKTCNVGPNVTWDEFKDVYMRAWQGGAKGITTFRAAGKRYGILNKADDGAESAEPVACYVDPQTGTKTCD